MLQAIRDRATGWIAWAIIGLICITFALFGIEQYLGGGGAIAVARVNDAEIGYYQYRGAVEQQRQQIQRMFGGALPEGLVDDATLREQALERLIGDEVLVQQAVSNGLRVGDRQLANAIRELPNFQQDGRFSQELYDSFLLSRGTAAAGFELDLRRSMLSEQVVTAVSRTAFVTEPELEAVLTATNEERRFRELRIDAASLEVPEPDDAAIRQRFESNPERFVLPEQVQVRYIELDRAAISAAVTASEEELRTIYDLRVSQGSFGKPEQREARHILLTVDADAPEADVDAARVRIEDLRGRITSGEDFAEVARAASEDPGSAPQGGALGQFGRGVMDPAFEEAAFAQAEGEVGEPVRSRFGWHLIQVTRIEAAEVRPFDEVRAEVLKEVQEAQSAEIFARRAEELASLTFENPQSLEVAAEALDVTPQTTGFFSRAGDGAAGIATSPVVREAAFSDDVRGVGNNSDLLEITPDRLVVLRVSEEQESRPQTLDEVRDGIADALRAEAAADRAAALGGEILASLRGGADPDQVAAEHGLEWGNERALTRGNAAASTDEVTTLVFRMAEPAADTASLDGVAQAVGDFTVVALSSVGQSESGSTGEAQQQLVQRLELSHGQQDYSAVMQGLREATDVEVFRQNLDPERGLGGG